MEAFEQYEAAMVGSHEVDQEQSSWTDDLSRDRVRAYLQRLEKQMEKRDGEAFRRGVRHLASLRSELRDHPELRPEEIEKALHNLAVTMAEQLVQELPRQRIQELKRSVRAELRIYKKRLKKETYQQLEKSYLQRHIRQEFQVPEMTLFELHGAL
jgi:flagellar biosynthesis/type III secretory pathway protein FliH